MTNECSKNIYNFKIFNVTEKDVIYLELKYFRTVFVKYIQSDIEIKIFYNIKYIHFININLFFLYLKFMAKKIRN